MFSIVKQSTESFPGVGFDFKARLPGETSLVSAVVSAIDTDDDSDATSIILVSPNAVISGTRALFSLQGGVSGKKYKITMLAAISGLASPLEENLLVIVDDI
jgi:hypothetical protein